MIWGPVLSAWIIGEYPGLAGGTERTMRGALYTANVAVRSRRPRAPFLRWDWMKAALALSCRCTLAVVSYPG